MKNTLALLAILFLSVGSAQAAFNLQELQQVEGLALEDFAKENADHAEHLTGWKTWKSGDDAKVKIYVAHAGMNMEFNYVCHKHGEASLQCHAQ